MNQQAQMPDPQKEGENGIEEYRLPSPYSWAAHPTTQGVPREEPPHSYQEPMTAGGYEQGYSAQNHAFQSEVEGQLYVDDRDNQEAIAQKLDQTQPRPQRQRHGADGDALESGYQPHLSPASQVPPWAKPQRHPRNKQGRMIAMLIVGLLLIKPLLILIALLGLTVIAVIILLLVLLPIVLLVLGVIALVIYNRRAKTNTANWGFQRGRGRYWHHQ